MKQLDLDEIVKYFDFKRDVTWYKKKDDRNENCSFLVMEIVEGVELLEFFNQANVQGKQLDDRFCRYIFKKVANALHLLHTAGVAHRDIKAENIMLTKNYKIKIIDLGYGVPISGKDGSFFCKTPLGTPIYMAPEVAEGKTYQGPDIDIFSFGVTLLTLRTMKQPFKQSANTDPIYRQLKSNKIDLFWRLASNKVKLTDEFKQFIELLL